MLDERKLNDDVENDFRINDVTMSLTADSAIVNQGKCISQIKNRA